jgi:hypothetical protein
LNNTLLKEQQVIEDIREKIKKFIKSNENEDTSYRTCGMQQRQT